MGDLRGCGCISLSNFENVSEKSNVIFVQHFIQTKRRESPLSSIQPHSFLVASIFLFSFFFRRTWEADALGGRLVRQTVGPALPIRCGIVSIGKICRLFRHLYQNYHCQWSPLVAKWWKVTIPHRTHTVRPSHHHPTHPYTHTPTSLLSPPHYTRDIMYDTSELLLKTWRTI